MWNSWLAWVRPRKSNKAIKQIIDTIRDPISEEEPDLSLYQFEKYDIDGIKKNLINQKKNIQNQFDKADELEFFEYWDHGIGNFLVENLHNFQIFRSVK